MKTTLILGVALVLSLVALPLLSFGTDQDEEVLWMTGLALVVVAGVMAPLTRFLPADDEDDEEDDDTDGADGAGG